MLAWSSSSGFVPGYNTWYAQTASTHTSMFSVLVLDVLHYCQYELQTVMGVKRMTIMGRDCRGLVLICTASW